MIRVANLRNEKYDVYIGRGSKWGNPFIINKDGNRAEVIRKYREYAKKFSREELLELKDKTLGCYCKPLACHGDVLKEMCESYGI
jgi:hypothetical protein